MKEFTVRICDDLKLQITPIKGEFDEGDKDLFGDTILHYIKTNVKASARYLGALFSLKEGFYETLFKICNEAKEIERQLDGEVKDE